jgi:AcrR family transcriptional regulator
MASARRETARRPYAARIPREQRREQVLDSALSLILSDGYAAVTMEAVARGAGVTKPVVYDLFPNMGELVRALLEREEEGALRQLGELLPKMLDEKADPDELMVQAFTAYLQAVSESADRWKLILLPAEGTPALVRDHVEAARRGVARQLEGIVEWAVARRAELQGVDAHLAALAMQAFAEHQARLVLTNPDEYTPERLGEFVARLIASFRQGS